MYVALPTEGQCASLAAQCCPVHSCALLLERGGQRRIRNYALLGHAADRTPLQPPSNAADLASRGKAASMPAVTRALACLKELVAFASSGREELHGPILRGGGGRARQPDGADIKRADGAEGA
eukprot:CAMPEP_0181239130 /NCGR_PEP_ID=MMETSP1096-20121128/39756_1 /TAXON_ID=156174 ORGANISM="Chrysochromulina ericina, Strain CCMP281" /NCGR_SAMPLE_ID=MMETSP1096 /ASSEMBLY_ACC=CAM_ASM_000453 /LENGTH=122 /DNA_ID=CAMNT_0023334779 /DNA_START=91 /DNA_END=457 /DNA_ORIENTATION=+